MTTSHYLANPCSNVSFQWTCNKMCLLHFPHLSTPLIPLIFHIFSLQFCVFHWVNSSSHIMAQRLTQSLTEISTRSVFWAGTWPHYHLHVLSVQKFLEPQHPGALRACNGIALPCCVFSCSFHYVSYILYPISASYQHTQGGADKSLARPTSRCQRMESIVSLERGVCSCAELQVFSCYRGWKEACQVMCVISTTWRCELSSIFFFSARQGAEGNSRHSDRNIRGTGTIVCHHQKLGGPV